MRHAAVLLLALAACDPAAGGDPPTDAPRPQPDAPGPGLATVLVLGTQNEGGLPLAGHAVYVVGPDGTAIEAVTGADGRASATIEPDSAVYVLRDGPNAELVVFTGVDPGAEIIAGGSARFTTIQPILGHTLVHASWPPNASSLQVLLPCGTVWSSFSTPFSMPVPDCATSARGTIVTLALDFAGRPIAHGVHADVDLAAAVGGQLALDAGLPIPTGRVVYTSIPEEVSSIATGLTYDDRGLVIAMSVGPTPTAGAILTFDVPAIPIGRTTVLRTFVNTQASAMSPVWNLRRYPDLRSEGIYDLGATMAPFISRPSYDPQTQTLAWTYLGGGGRRPDVVTARMLYFVDRNVSLIVHADGADTHVQLRFPPQLAGVQPREFEFIEMNEIHAVELVGGDHADAVRTIDPENRLDLDASTAFADWDDVWISGRLL